MLPFHGRWRNAPKRAPEREARLLMFAESDDPYADYEDDPGNTGGGRRRGEDVTLTPEEEEAIRNTPTDQMDEELKRDQLRAKRLREKREEAARRRVANQTQTTAGAVNAAVNAATGTGTGAGTAATTDANGQPEQREEDEEEVTLSSVSLETNTYMERLRDQASTMELLEKEIGTHLDQESREKWKELKQYFEQQLGEKKAHADLLKILEKLEENEEVEIPPQTTIATLLNILDKKIKEAKAKREEWAHFENLRQKLNAAGLRILDTRRNPTPENPNVSDIASWTVLTKEQRAKAYEDLKNDLDLDDTLETIHEDIEEANAILGKDEVKKLVDKVFEGRNKNKDEGSSGTWSFFGALNKMFDSAGIDFITPKQILMAFADLKERMQEVSKSRNRLKAAGLARQMGNIIGLIPKYRDIQPALEAAHDKENDEEKKGFSESLGASKWQPGFDEMFERGGILDREINNKNRTRAILEYAAGNGMLYNIQRIDDWKKEKLLGRWHFKDLVPNDWGDKQINSYFGNLQYDNEQGEKKRTELGVNSIRSANQISQYVKALDGALKGKDLWFAKGIVERAMDKVDKGWMSSALTVTIMRRMEDPTLRSIAPERWMDQLGGIGKPLMIGLIKFDRNDILNKWDKGFGEKGIRQVRRIGNIVADAREYLIEKDPSLAATDEDTVKKLDEFTAKFMACHTLTLDNGKKASIFNQRFNKYLDIMSKEEMRDIDTEKTGDDFFVHRSELLRVKPAVVKSILTSDTGGHFRYETKAIFFLSHADETYGELLKATNSADPNERAEFTRSAKNFQKIMSGKLSYWFRSVVKDRDPLFLSEQRMSDQQRFALLTLLQKGLLDIGILEEVFEKNWSAKKLSTELIRQVRTDRDTPAAIRQKADQIYERHLGQGRRAA